MRGRTTVLTVGVALAALTLTGCAGNSVEGEYFGSAGNTKLVLAPDGKCAYTEYWDAENDEPLELDEKCKWTVSGTTVTLANYSSSERTIQGLLSENGDISFPDQDGWNGEIYAKK